MLRRTLTLLLLWLLPLRHISSSISTQLGTIFFSENRLSPGESHVHFDVYWICDGKKTEKYGKIVLWYHISRKTLPAPAKPLTTDPFHKIHSNYRLTLDVTLGSPMVFGLWWGSRDWAGLATESLSPGPPMTEFCQDAVKVNYPKLAVSGERKMASAFNVILEHCV